MKLERDDYIKLYRNMVLSRKLEERMSTSATEGKIVGWMHMGLGQEAVGVGGATFLRSDDYLLHTHRGFAHVISKGCSLEKIIAEQYGKKTGTTGGKGGTFHLVDKHLGMCGVYGSIGGNFVIAVGFGLAAQWKGKGQIVAVFFGDGASNRGTFHEAMNLASIWKLPIVWICENNQYGVSLHVSKSIATPNIADRALAYNIPGTVVDGQDVLAVFGAVQEAADRARAGHGPSLVEAKTYRFRGHYEGDRQNYRPPEELGEIQKEDPIEKYRVSLLKMNILSPELVTQIDHETSKEVEEAEKLAAEAPNPDIKNAFEGLYA
jgi:TPP-dependent pyruvate/acetoin dehydrogenase alpha subunit